MKIVRSPGSKSSLNPNQEEVLDHYLQQMLNNLGWLRDTNPTIGISFQEKDKWRSLLEEVTQGAYLNLLQTTPKPVPTNHEFHKFPELPTELRIEIWELAFGLDFVQAPVHCIDERGGRFISNRPVSPLLHACYEARNIYLSHPSRRGVMFAFGTYIDFSSDIIYLINFEEDTDKFARFLGNPFAEKICSLAMRKSLACEIPMEGHMSEVQWNMKEVLEEWMELSVVFHDERTPEEAWKDVDMQFRDLSAREKRKHAEIGYARFYMKTLNNSMRMNDVQETNCRFVCVA